MPWIVGISGSNTQGSAGRSIPCLMLFPEHRFTGAQNDELSGLCSSDTLGLTSKFHKLRGRSDATPIHF